MVVDSNAETVLTFGDGSSVQLRKGSRPSLLSAWVIPAASSVSSSTSHAARLLRSDCAARAAKIDPYFRGSGKTTTAYVYFGPDIPAASYSVEIFGPVALFFTDPNDDEPAGALSISLINVILPPNRANTFENKSVFSSICEGKQVYELRLTKARAAPSTVFAWTTQEERDAWAGFMSTYIARMDSFHSLDIGLLQDCSHLLRVEGGMAIIKRKGTASDEVDAPGTGPDSGSRKWMYLLWTGDPVDWSILICGKSVPEEKLSLGVCKIPALECKRLVLNEIENVAMDAEPSTSFRIEVRKQVPSRSSEPPKSFTIIIDGDPASRSRSLLWVEAIRNAKNVSQILVAEARNKPALPSIDLENLDYRDQVFLASLQGRLIESKNNSAPPQAKPLSSNWFSRSFRFSSKDLSQSKDTPSLSSDGESSVSIKHNGDNKKRPISARIPFGGRSVVGSNYSTNSLAAAPSFSHQTVDKSTDHSSSAYSNEPVLGRVSSPATLILGKLQVEDIKEESEMHEVIDESDEDEDEIYDNDSLGREAEEGHPKGANNKPQENSVSVSCFAFLFRTKKKDDSSDEDALKPRKSRRSSFAADADLPIPGGHGDAVHRTKPKRVSFFSPDNEAKNNDSASPSTGVPSPSDPRDFGGVDAKLKNRIWAVNSDQIVRADALAMESGDAPMPPLPNSAVQRDSNAQPIGVLPGAAPQRLASTPLVRASSFLDQIETEYYSHDQDDDSGSDSNSKNPAYDNSQEGKSRGNHAAWWDGVSRNKTPASPRVVALTLKSAKTSSSFKASQPLMSQEQISVSNPTISIRRGEFAIGRAVETEVKDKEPERPRTETRMQQMPRRGPLKSPRGVAVKEPSLKSPSRIVKHAPKNPQSSGHSSSLGSAGAEMRREEYYYVLARLKDIDVVLELRRVDVVLYPRVGSSIIFTDAIAKIFLSGMLSKIVTF